MTYKRRIHLNELIKRDPVWISWAVFLSAVSDASFVPLPAQTFFLLVAAAYQKKAWKYTVLATFGTIIGAILSYYTGRLVFLKHGGQLSNVAQSLLNNLPGFSSGAFYGIQQLFLKWHNWILFTASFIAIPFSFFAISAGALDIDLTIFIITVLISQALKYILLAFFVARLGNKVKNFVIPRLKPFRMISFITLLLIFIAS
ncbi:MAG TPA: VTT domain-containing protein [Bacteroidales bacterium]|nr:VTT domain-containing protein [Bacteroidales bacterium]